MCSGLNQYKCAVSATIVFRGKIVFRFPAWVVGEIESNFKLELNRIHREQSHSQMSTYGITTIAKETKKNQFSILFILNLRAMKHNTIGISTFANL